MTAEEVVERAAERANAAIAKEERRAITYDELRHEWREGRTVFGLAALNGEIMYRVPGYELIRLTHRLASYDEQTIASVTRSVLNALKVDLPTDAELREQAIARARRCPRCGADTSLMIPKQIEKLGSSLVQWDIVCPECHSRHWVDLRARERADHSPFYSPPTRRRRSR